MRMPSPPSQAGALASSWVAPTTQGWLGVAPSRATHWPPCETFSSSWTRSHVDPEDNVVDGFTLTYDDFDPAEEGLREALTSTGNGYFCTRGAAEWEEAEDVHYPGTYAHDVYNRETTIMGGRPVPNEDLVTLPNWLVLKLRIDGEELVRLGNVELLSYRHELDVRYAVLLRE